MAASCTRKYDGTRKSRWSVKACSDSGRHFYRVEKLPVQSCAVNLPLRRDPVVTSMVTSSGSRFAFCQRSEGKHSLPGYGSVTHGNRLVRTRMPGGVGAGGEIPPATRLGCIPSFLVFGQHPCCRLTFL